MRRTLGVSAAVAMAAGLVVTVPAAASATEGGDHRPYAVAPADDASTLKTYSKSKKCIMPTKKKFSISYTPGSSSTKVGYKNRCLETKRMRIWYSSNGTRCKNITVKPGVYGSQKVKGITKKNLKNVDFGKCPRIPAAATSG